MALSAVRLLLAQASAPTAAPAPGLQDGLKSMLPFGLMALAFYFLLLAPQRKKQKEHEKMLTALQPGDEIVTTGGIYGVIASVKDDRFVVRIADSTKVEIGKGFVQAVVKSQAAGGKK